MGFGQIGNGISRNIDIIGNAVGAIYMPIELTIAAIDITVKGAAIAGRVVASAKLPRQLIDWALVVAFIHHIDHAANGAVPVKQCTWAAQDLNLLRRGGFRCYRVIGRYR